MISGKSMSGKDTLAEMFKTYCELKNKTVLTIHFGDAVKWIARDYYGWNGEKDIHGRTLLQTIGTDIMRKKYPSYWGRIVSKFISAAASWDYVLIPDWRFKNEFEEICDRNEDVVTIRIERYNQDGTLFINPNMTVDQANHISEHALDKFPVEYIVENRGDIDDLYDSVEVIMEDMGE